MIAEELIAEIRSRTDIVALIGEYVALKQRGASFTGLCPFHSEKTPSFHVRRDRQFFHCFGCHESGDAVTFLMRVEGLNFPQAARLLAERAGIDLPDTDDREDHALRRKRERDQRLCALMEVATQFYVERLADHPQSKVARDELAARGVSAETAAKFRLGYAPLAWDALATWLEQRDYSLADAELLGLVQRRQQGRGYYDRFRHRLMFPIADLQGRIVAFSGRILPDPTAKPDQPSPKYVNSPESPIYKKGEVLFGLHAARVEIRRNGWAIVCEGNFDLLALHQAGFQNVVAPLGTAFTQAQARLLRRFAQRVTLMFDGDAAGRKAAHAAYPLLKGADLTGRVARLPSGDDPDSFLRKHGAEGLKQRLEAALGIIEFLIDTAAEAAGPAAEARAAAIQTLGPVLVTNGNPVEIELYIERIAQRFSLSDLGVVKQQLRRGVRAASGIEPKPVAETKLAVREDRVKLPELALQRDLLGALLDKPELFRSDHSQHLSELLTAEDLRAIFSAAAAQIEEFGALDAQRLVREVPGNEAVTWLREQLSVETYSDHARAEEVLRKGIPLLRKHRVERERAELAARIQQARQRGDESLAIALTKQRDATRIKL
ncbi:MAG TPA: DNA primase [Polyangiales bacterium]|nr:DNA primase [Polyangiales bacterium]